MEKVKVFIEKIHQDAILPSYANVNDAGMDVYALEEALIYPKETCLVRTGIKVAIPEGYEIQIRPRSGISLNTPLRIPNTPGTIDSGYRGEVCIIIENTSEKNEEGFYTIKEKGNKQGVYKILKHDRICQMVLSKVPRIVFQEVDSVNDLGTNRGGGFGSSGFRK